MCCIHLFLHTAGVSERFSVWKDRETFLLQLRKCGRWFCAAVSNQPGRQNESYSSGGLRAYCKYCSNAFSFILFHCHTLLLFITLIRFQDFVYYDPPKQPLLGLLTMFKWGKCTTITFLVNKPSAKLRDCRSNTK